MNSAGANGRTLTLNVQEFILNHKVEKGCEFTHTSLARPAASFYVPADELDGFYAIYASAVENKEDLHITEKNRHIGPLLIDLDFRYVLDANSDGAMARQYTQDDIVNIVKKYMEIVAEYLELNEAPHIYVMEKSVPTQVKNLKKDGLHIIVPNVITKASVKYLIRKRALDELRQTFIDMSIINDVSDIIDEAVIERNNWFMYGSKKVGSEPYEITKIYEYNVATGSLTEVKKNAPCLDNVKLLSIRNKYTENDVKSDKFEEVTLYENREEEKRRQMELRKHVVTQEQNKRIYTSENIEQVEQLVEILSENRANNYNDWIRLGWCLRNIDNRLLDKWIEFSKKSPKYKDGECEKMWDHMRDGGLGIGTLHMWARCDSPQQYKEIIRADLRQIMYNSTTGTHYDIAQVVYHMFKHEYACASVKNRFWYEFKNHRWRVSDSGLGLRMKISDDVWREYHQAACEYTQSAILNTNTSDQMRLQELAKKMQEIAIKLRITSFKENIMKECTELFYVDKFEEKLDSNPNLIGFEDGVFDLEAMEFREGRPEDFVSFSTGNNFVEYNPYDPCQEEINTFLSQVLPKPHMKDYVMKLFSTFLSGHIREQKFNIWTGSGGNGKSVCVELFEKAFGEYCCKFPITLLTQKRAASNAATSELARAKGKRFGCLQEPSEDEKLNIGLMKELSGGDKILARAIYKEPIEFKPMFKMLLLCNQLPHVPSDDGGTWRRIRVVEFTSKFVEDPKGENEYMIDYTLTEKLEKWKGHFMALLIDYYRKYQREGMQEPPEVLKCTTEYKNNNDHMASFVMSKVEKKDSAFLSLDEIYQELRNWIRDDGVNLKQPSKPDVEKYLSKNLTKCVVHNAIKGFKGFRIRSAYSNDDDDDDLIN